MWKQDGSAALGFAIVLVADNAFIPGELCEIMEEAIHKSRRRN